MNQELQSRMMSRRKAISLAIGFGAALPATLAVVSESWAQTPGMERREERREDRQDRREDRRDDREDRREDRRDDREDRRDARQGAPPPATTGSSTQK